MDDDLLDRKEDDARWVASAADVEPPALPEKKPQVPRSPDARRALYLAIAGMFGLGIVLSPIALAVGRRAQIKGIADDHRADAGLAHTAITLGKMGFALHLAIAISVLPWLLFLLPFLRG